MKTNKLCPGLLGSESATSAVILFYSADGKTEAQRGARRPSSSGFRSSSISCVTLLHCYFVGQLLKAGDPALSCLLMLWTRTQDALGNPCQFSESQGCPPSAQTATLDVTLALGAELPG